MHTLLRTYSSHNWKSVPFYLLLPIALSACHLLMATTFSLLFFFLGRTYVLRLKFPSFFTSKTTQVFPWQKFEIPNKFTKLPWKYRASLILHVGACFSHVWLCATPWTVAHQAPLSMGFSRQEYCSGLPFPSPCTLKTSFFPFHPQVDKAMISPFTLRELRVMFSTHWKYLVGKFPTDTITGDKLRLVSFKFN